MKLYDIEAERNYTLPELFKEWKAFRQEDPVNHAESFTAELFEIIMATINGRNDCEIIGPTASELDRYTRKIRKEVEKNEH